MGNILHTYMDTYDGHVEAFERAYPYFNLNLSNKDTKSAGYADYWKYNL